jgi:hypothetical protein
MSLDLIPSPLHQRYRFEERHHATSILATDFREEFNDILLCLKLSLPKMPSGANAFETNDIQEDEIASALTKAIRV